MNLHIPEIFNVSVTSGFRRDADEICALLGFKAAPSGKPLPTFRDNVWVPVCCPETSVKDYHSTLRYTSEECRSNI
jgi:hypothetical protein